jgi:hypothetical protein
LRPPRAAPAAAAAAAGDSADGRASEAPGPRARAGKEPPSAFETILKSPVTRTVAGTITRGLMGALLGSLGVKATRRPRRY